MSFLNLYTSNSVLSMSKYNLLMLLWITSCTVYCGLAAIKLCTSSTSIKRVSNYLLRAVSNRIITWSGVMIWDNSMRFCVVFLGLSSSSMVYCLFTKNFLTHYSNASNMRSLSKMRIVLSLRFYMGIHNSLRFYPRQMASSGKAYTKGCSSKLIEYLSRKKRTLLARPLIFTRFVNNIRPSVDFDVQNSRRPCSSVFRSIVRRF
jgi:hypothetical protein